MKEDSGFLLARNFGYWSRRQNEVPESIWRKVEPKEVGQLPTLEQALFFATSFREDQLANGETNYPVCRANLTNVYECLESLKLYATLSPKQRELAESDEGLGMADLGGSQRDEMISTALKLILEHYGCTYELAKSLALNGLGADQLNNFRFTAKWKNRVSNYAVIGKKIVEQPTSEELNRQTLWFTISLSKREGITQYIDLKK